MTNATHINTNTGTVREVGERQIVAELCEALEELCSSVEREEELNGSISGTLMSDVREARAALAQARGETA